MQAKKPIYVNYVNYIYLSRICSLVSSRGPFTRFTSGMKIKPFQKSSPLPGGHPQHFHSDLGS